MGLKWVYQNIIDFGGDPNRITLFGCSAGGRSVGAQVMTPYNDNLIFGAIGQSKNWKKNLKMSKFRNISENVLRKFSHNFDFLIISMAPNCQPFLKTKNK